MKDNRRDFIKKSASLAAAMSIGGIASAIPTQVEKKKVASARPYKKDVGIKFAFAMSPDSPKVPFAQ